MSNGTRKIVRAIHAKSASVTNEERDAVTRALDALNDAKEVTTRAQIAQATAELDYAQIERTLAKKYQLNAGDAVNADGTITRKQG